MSELTRRPLPRGRDVVREQIRVVALRFRREAQIFAAFLLLGTLIVGADIIVGSPGSWFDSDTWSLVSWLSFLCAFGVWRGENQFGPAFLWTLPVDRRRIALAKVFAGWVWLMAALAAFVCWEGVLGAASGLENTKTIPPEAFVGATAMYLLGSAAVLGLRHPLRWFAGGACAFFLLAAIIDGINFEPEVMGEARRVESMGRAGLPFVYALWLLAGLVALWAAVRRHRENR